MCLGCHNHNTESKLGAYNTACSQLIPTHKDDRVVLTGNEKTTHMTVMITLHNSWWGRWTRAGMMASSPQLFQNTMVIIPFQLSHHEPQTVAQN